jgi:hypothetical protein
MDYPEDRKSSCHLPGKSGFRKLPLTNSACEASISLGHARLKVILKELKLDIAGLVTSRQSAPPEDCFKRDPVRREIPTVA